MCDLTVELIAVTLSRGSNAEKRDEEQIEHIWEHVRPHVGTMKKPISFRYRFKLYWVLLAVFNVISSVFLNFCNEEK